jgi:predicted dehydrogenase
VREVRFGLVGLGHWGPNYARLLNGMVPGARLVGCAELREGRRQAMAQLYPGLELHADHRGLLASGGIDAAIVATTAVHHRSIVEECLRGGLHVLVEKPLANNVEAAEAMVLAAEQTGMTLMVGHTFLFNPAVERIKRALDEDELGRPLYFAFRRTGLGPIRQDVNALWDLAPHDLSMLRHWLGTDPVEVTARGQSYLRDDVEDVVFLTLRYPGGVLAGIQVSWLDPVKDRRVTIVGDRRMVVYDDVHPTEKLRVYDKGASYQPRGGEFSEFLAAVRDGDILIPKLANSEPLREELVHFVECVRTGCQPRSDGRDGLAVVRILERAQADLTRTSPPAAGAASQVAQSAAAPVTSR